jgi:hypothetical protein
VTRQRSHWESLGRDDRSQPGLWAQSEREGFFCRRGKQGEAVDVVDFPDKALKLPLSKLYTIH